MAKARSPNLTLGVFVEAAVHHILWKRNVYPKNAFYIDRERIPGAEFFYCADKPVQDYVKKYISDVVQDVKNLSVGGGLSVLAICIFDDGETSTDSGPLEKFQFKFSRLSGDGNVALDCVSLEIAQTFFSKVHVLVPLRERVPNQARNTRFTFEWLRSAQAQGAHNWVLENRRNNKVTGFAPLIEETQTLALEVLYKMF